MLFQLAKYLTVGIATYTIGVDLITGTKCAKMQQLPTLEKGETTYKRDELLSSVKPTTGVVEDLDDRKEWNRLCNCKPENPAHMHMPCLHPGDYTFVYRNYVDFEEQYAMASQRSPLHRLVFDRRNLTKMSVTCNGQVSMVETFRIFGVKTVVEWRGHLVNDTIHWYMSTITIAGRYIKKTPKVSELKRDKPWRLIHEDFFYIFEMVESDSPNKRLVFVPI